MRFACVRLLHVLLAALLLSGNALADLANKDNLFSVSGFGSVGAAYNSTGKADFARGITQDTGAGYTRRWEWRNDSLLGLQLNAKPTDDIEGVVQLVSQYDYEHTVKPKVTWAFLKWTPNENFQVRAGRLGFEVYLLSDSRNVGYSYLWARPPVEYFGTIPVSHLDGVDGTVTHPIGPGLARVKLFAGKATEKAPTRFDNSNVDLGDSALGGGFVEYQLQKWLIRYSYAQLQIKRETELVKPLLDVLHNSSLLTTLGADANAVASAANFADDMAIENHKIKFISVGLAYDDGPLQSQLIVSRRTSSTLSYSPTRATYFLLGYRVGQWTPYYSYSQLVSEHSSRTPGLPLGVNAGLDAIQAGGLRVTSNSLAKQDTHAVGVRYDFRQNLDLKFQLDRVHAYDQETFLWGNVQPQWDGRATIYSVVLDFTF